MERKYYILQEKTFDYGWFDIYDSDDYDFIVKMFNVFDSKYYDKTYRVVEVLI